MFSQQFFRDEKDDFAALGAEVHRRWQLTCALQNFASGKQSAAEDTLVNESTHQYGDPSTGFAYLSSIYNTRASWKPAFDYAKNNGYPFLFLRQQLFWDGFPGKYFIRQNNSKNLVLNFFDYLFTFQPTPSI